MTPDPAEQDPSRHAESLLDAAGSPIQPEDMTDEVWDYIFLGKELQSETKIPSGLLERMRREFDYWYPFDMRVSPYLAVTVCSLM